MNRIALINQKGGVSKTTSCQNIGAALSKLRKKVLLVDIDPQAHLTYSAGVQSHDLDLTIYDLLYDQADLASVMLTLENGVSIIPSTLELSRAELDFTGMASWETRLKSALKPARGFDYILIDCPPSLGFLTVNALVASDSVIIPVQVESLPLLGLSALLDVIDRIKELNPKLSIKGVVATRYDGRKNLTKDVMHAIKKRLGDGVFKTPIRENVSLAEAPSHGKDIFSYKPRSHGAEDYLKLAKEIIKRG